jgi:hypothetical protein
MTTRSMPRHEAWRLAYREHRYCQHLSRQELNRRVRDVFLRMLTLTPEAKIGVLGVDPEGIRWMELWTHVLEEMALRFGPYPSGFTREILHNEPFPDFAGELAARAASRLEHLRGTNVAIKFGKPEHMQALYEHGALRIQAASFYRRPDHNGAIRDDELALDISLHLDRETILKIVSNPQDVPAAQLSQRIDVSFASKTDYWLYCVTTAVAPRLFVDFEAHACVVIKDLRRFTHAMRQVVAPKVGRAQLKSGAVVYVDPVLPQTGMIDVPMSKHFRYSHQQEHRFVWLPNEPAHSLPHLDVELGSLEEYAELISL